MSLSEIFDIIQNPDFKYILKSKLTIKEGNTIPEVAKAFSEILDMSDDDIIKAWSNQEYLKSLIKDYWFIDNSILNRNILYPLEGYLYPDTYYVTDEKIYSIQQILNNMLKNIEYLSKNATSVAKSTSLAGTLPAATVRMAIAVIGLLPILVIYPFVQKYFVKGVMIGSVKG